MKNTSPHLSKTKRLAPLAAGLAAAGLLLSGSATQAQPAIANVFPDGSVLFQGQAPNPNTLTFGVSSAATAGVTGVTVKLTATSLPGVVTVSTLTSGSGLQVSGTPDSENITAPLAADTVYSAAITTTDANGSTSQTVNFDTITSSYYTFEAEDFDASSTNGPTILHDQFIDNPQVNQYYQLFSTYGIDYEHNRSGNQNYRPFGLETEGATDTARAQYSSQTGGDFDVGYNNGGDWGNYTRTYPPGLYNLYVRLSGGNGFQSNACGLSLVTGGLGAPNASTMPLGDATTLGKGWQTYTFQPILDQANLNLVAWAAAGDVETLQLNIIGGNCNENFFLLVPASPVLSQASTNVFQGDPISLSIDGKALTGAPAYQWQTDNGSGGASWANVSSGGVSSTFTPPTTQLGPVGYQVVLSGISSTLSSVTVTSAPVYLHINATTKPLIVQDTTPSSDTEFVGTISSFTATFNGNLPITNQWKISTNGGTTFSDLVGQNGNVLLVTNLVPVTNVEYELVASNPFGSTASTPATLNVNPAPPPPPLQLAGNLIVNLQENDLAPGITVWTNRTGASSSVGNFMAQGGAVLNIPGGIPPWGATPVNALYVNGNGSQAVVSALQAPVAITGANPVSIETWAYATAISGNNTVLGYGIQGGSSDAYADREFDYGSGGNGAFSGNFGGDFPWVTGPAIGEWHYLAWTFDGANVVAYLDGVANASNDNQSPNTADSLIVVGGGIANSGPNLTDNFFGYIASARVSDGVLSPDQVLNNFKAGLTAVPSVTVFAPTIAPTNTAVTVGNSATLSVDDTGALFAFTYQWQTDSGSGGASWSSIPDATNSSYVVDTTGLAPGLYEYEVVLSNTNSVTVTSSPLTIMVVAQTPPAIVQDTTPLTLSTYVTVTNTFTATFSGEAPLDLQWEVSVNNGATFNPVPGETSTNLTIESEVPVTNLYRLKATNPLGTNYSSAAELAVLAAPPLPAPTPLEVAGDLIVNLQAADLASATAIWPNATISTNSVGNFGSVILGGSNLNTTANAPAYLYHHLTALYVDGVGAHSVQSALNAPNEIIANGNVSVEAWIYSVNINPKRAVVNYGHQVNSSFPQEEREFCYDTGPSGIASGDFGSLDTAWPGGVPTEGVWHYLVYTYDGTNQLLTAYQDGLEYGPYNIANPNQTAQTFISVGSAIGNNGAINAGNDAFDGFVGAARVESGLLTADQVTANYNAGLFAVVPIAYYPPNLQFAANGASLTLTWPSGGTLLQATSVSGPWTTNTATSPLVLTPASGGPAKFFKLIYNQ